MSLVIPFDQLQPETLDALIEEFVTRDGAIHGHADDPLPQKIESIRRQLKSGDITIVFDEESESCTIMPANSHPAPARADATDEEQDVHS